MEGLQFDPGEEDDATEIKAEKKTSGSTKETARKFAQELVDLFVKDTPEASPKKSDEQKAETETSQQEAEPEEVEDIETTAEVDDFGLDNTPELTEAPVEHLSKVETEAINQTLATERLAEIRADEEVTLSEQEQASETFLEYVEASGEVDEAFEHTKTELGLEEEQPAAYEEVVVPTPIPTEIVIAAQQSIGLTQEQAAPVSTERQSKATTTPRPEIITPRSKIVKKEIKTTEVTRIEPQEIKHTPELENMVDYLAKRREARVRQKSDLEPVKQSLKHDVVELKQNLITKERQIRDLAQNRTTELPAAELLKRQLKKEPYERSAKALDKPELAPLRAQTMSKTEIVSLAGRINIEGTNLRQAFEAHLIGEKGLRRVIAVYLRGGDLARSLKRELVERQIDFERDPNLRDQDITQPMKPKTNDIDTLLKNSGINWFEPNDQGQAKVSAPQPLGTNVNNPEPIEPKTATPHTVGDVLLIIAILILLAVILALILNR